MKLVLETGQALKTIGEQIAHINQHMNAIATSAKEQSTGLAEVNVAVNSMDQTTQQNAAMVEQSTAASASLALEAAKLRDLVAQFRLQAASMQSVAFRRGSKRDGGVSCFSCSDILCPGDPAFVIRDERWRVQVSIGYAA